MSECENDATHNGNYCEVCATCHDCLEEANTTSLAQFKELQARIAELEGIKRLAFDLNEAILCNGGGSPDAHTKYHAARIALQQALSTNKQGSDNNARD